MIAVTQEELELRVEEIRLRIAWEEARARLDAFLDIKENERLIYEARDELLQ